MDAEVSEFVHFLMAMAVIVVPLYCAWLVIERLARRRRKSRSQDRL